MGRFENSEREKRNPLLLPVILLSACVVILGLLLVIRQPDNDAASQPVPTSEEETTAPAVVADSDVVLSYDTDLCIPTAYCTLHLPEQWSDCMHVVQSKRGTAYAYTFYASLENREEISLFVIHFGEDGEMPLGMWNTDSGQTVYMSLTPQSLDFDESWTVEEMDLVCAMQESTNYMLQALTASPKFTPAS